MALPYSSDCLSPPFATSHLPFHSCSPSFYLPLSLAPSFYLSPALPACRSALLHINFTRFTCAYPAQATCNIWRQFFCAHRQNIPECCQEGRERRCRLLCVCVCVDNIVWLQIKCLCFKRFLSSLHKICSMSKSCQRLHEESQRFHMRVNYETSACCCYCGGSVRAIFKTFVCLRTLEMHLNLNFLEQQLRLF